MTIIDPIAIYNQRVSDLETDRKLRKNKQAIIAWLRFGCVVGMAAALFYHKDTGWALALLLCTACLATFLRLLVLTARNNDFIHNIDLLLVINRQELDIAGGVYANLADGSVYTPPLHDYAQDLDIFGPGSLYQYTNRTTSEQGQQTYSAWLLNPAHSDLIIQRQQAAKELSPLYHWRQQLHAYGLDHVVTIITQRKMERWLRQPLQFLAPSWKFIRVFLPAIILVASLLTIITDWIPTPVFYGFAFIFFIISSAISRKVQPIYTDLDKVVQEISTLAKILAWVESAFWTSPALTQLQNVLTRDHNASTEVRQLNRILERMELRLNPFLFIFLNTFLCWDLQQVLALEKWKRRNMQQVDRWFQALGDIEALSTVATLYFNHPFWCIPTLTTHPGVIAATDLGHPLIPVKQRVTSNFTSSGTPQIALVTGSNMAGKSTFLRSIGVNMVLGMMGAPVCASALTVTPMRVISSMRVTDNLQENTSTFYAELKKLKYIIEAVHRHEMVFLLLDEILRGTNSLDRQVGSKALIRQLIKEHAAGMLATHDLELAEMVDTYREAITNYHFDVQVENEELFFDYKLKKGVCKSLNASILMKKIGIDL